MISFCLSIPPSQMSFGQDFLFYQPKVDVRIILAIPFGDASDRNDTFHLEMSKTSELCNINVLT